MLRSTPARGCHSASHAEHAQPRARREARKHAARTHGTRRGYHAQDGPGTARRELCSHVRPGPCCSVRRRVAACGAVLQRAAPCCSVRRRVAACGAMLQRAAATAGGPTYLKLPHVAAQ
jgi:hypothetical protein